MPYEALRPVGNDNNTNCFTTQILVSHLGNILVNILMIENFGISYRVSIIYLNKNSVDNRLTAVYRFENSVGNNYLV